MTKIIRAILGIALAALIAGGVWWWTQQQTQATRGLTGSGTIEAQQINIGPEVSGRVVQVSADEGQKVTAGQVLLRLDSTLLDAQRAQAEAAVKTARAQRDQLVARARPEQLEAARATISSTQASLSGAQADLRRLLSGATHDQTAAVQAQLKAVRERAHKEAVIKKHTNNVLGYMLGINIRYNKFSQSSLIVLCDLSISFFKLLLVHSQNLHVWGEFHPPIFI